MLTGRRDALQANVGKYWLDKQIMVLSTLKPAEHFPGYEDG